MLDRIRKLFKVFPGEGSKVLYFSLLGALIQAGVAMGLASADAMFLTQVGADKLPLIYIAFPVFTIAFTPLFSFLISRFGIHRLLASAIWAVLLLTGVFFFLLSKSPIPAWVLYAFKIYSALLWVALYTLFWNYVDGFFDILDAKRLFALINGGLATGAMIGGGLVVLLIRYLEIPQLLWIWALLLLLTWPTRRAIERRWPRLEEYGEEALGFLGQTRVVLGTIRRSRFVFLIFLVLFTSMFVLTLSEYQYLDIFSQMDDEKKLAGLLGTLFAGANVFNLVMNLFLFNRLVHWVGVRNTALIQPLSMLVVFSALFLVYGESAALLAFFVYQGVQTSVDNNNWNLMFNALPSGTKAEVRTFIEGLCEPLATSVAGLFLLFGAPRMNSEQISTIGIALASLFLIFVLGLRNKYVEAMVSNLKRNWLSFSRKEEDIVGHLSSDETQVLRGKLNHTNPDVAALAARFLWINDRNEALEGLLHTFRQSRAAQEGAMVALFGQVLALADHRVIRKVWQWLEEDPVVSPGVVEALVQNSLIPPETLRDTDRNASREAVDISLLAHWNSWDPRDNLETLEHLRDFVDQPQEGLVRGIRLLGKLGVERYSHFLISYLDFPDAEVREETLKAIEALATPESTRLVPALLKTIGGSESTQRELALHALAKIGDSDSIIPVLKLSSKFNSFERRLAGEMIEKIGFRAVPTLVAIVRDVEQPYRARSIAARTLGRVAFPQMESLLPEVVGVEFHRAYQFLYLSARLKDQSLAWDHGRGVTVLRQFYQDMHSTILEFILEMLTIGGRLPEYELISSSLRSKNPKVRGNAIETLEQAVDHRVFRHLLPLVDSRDIEAKIRFFKRNYPVMQVTPEQIVKNALDGTFSLERCAAAQACWEIGIPDADTLLREKMHGSPDEAFRETVISLFSRKRGESSLCLVDKIFHLMQPRIFSLMDIANLEGLAEIAEMVELDEGDRVFQKGDPADAIFCVLEGAIRLGDDTERVGGEMVGEEALFGQTTRAVNAVSRHARVLRLDLNQVISEMSVFPRIALALLETRLVS